MNEQPQRTLQIGATQITLLGTAHVSRASAEAVEAALATGAFDAVAIELCASRHNALVNPDSLEQMDLFKVLRQGKASMVTAQLALGAYQQRIAEQFGIEPGAEMRMAIHAAKERNLPVLLIDREIGATLKRTYRNVPWWKRAALLATLLSSITSREKITEAQIEKLKEGDMLETALAEFSDNHRVLFEPLIDERDQFMAAHLTREAHSGNYKHILAVVGAGHLKGIERYLNQPKMTPEQTIHELARIPPPSFWPKLIPWTIVLLILGGFVAGFLRNPELGWSFIIDWVVLTGGLSALGVAISGGHPLTIVSAFFAAPITTLNPVLGVGMITAPVELWLRKPNVGDFSQLRKDTLTLKGWRRNRVARVLLVFLFSSIGAAIGLYVAGAHIIGALQN